MALTTNTIKSKSITRQVKSSTGSLVCSFLCTITSNNDPLGSIQTIIYDYTKYNKLIEGVKAARTTFITDMQAEIGEGLYTSEYDTSSDTATES